jgi:hypothetical protein
VPGDGKGSLRETTERLEVLIAEVPRAADFQPLADHLYELAQTTPKLLSCLRAVPAAVEPLQESAQALLDVSDSLQATCQRFSESMLRIPRGEDYEPLVEPLREFTRVAPALTQSLAKVMQSVGPLTQAAARLETAPKAAAPPAAAARPTALAKAADQMAQARTAIEAALDSLPRDRDYARVAAQLREIATVSPSLSEWLKEAKSLSLPLGDSIASLEDAAQILAEGETALRRELPKKPRR